MSDNAIISIIDQGATIHVHLGRGGDPVSLGLRLLETGKADLGSKRHPGELSARLLTTLVCADGRLNGDKQSVRLVEDFKNVGPVAFSYAVNVHANAVDVKAMEHGRNGTKAGNGQAKVLYDGAVGGYFAAMKVPAPENWERRWLVEVISVEQDIYHRMFTATEAQAAKLRALIEVLVKAKELKGGSVVPVTAFETRYTVDNLIGQLTDLVGAGAVKRAAVAIAAPAAKATPKSPKPSGPSTKPKLPGGAGKVAK